MLTLMEYLPDDDTDSTLNGLFDLPLSNRAILLNLERVLPFIVRFLIDGDCEKAGVKKRVAMRTIIIGKTRIIIIPFNSYKNLCVFQS